jgi:hypothetical protein
MDLHTHSPLRLHGVLLNKLSTGTNYSYHNFGHYPVFYLKTLCFGQWIVSPSSGGTYSDGPNGPETETSSFYWAHAELPAQTIHKQEMRISHN